MRDALLVAVLAVLLPGVPLLAQSTQWEAVKRIDPGTQLRLRVAEGSLTCRFLDANDEGFRCESRHSIFRARQPDSFSRGEVRTVRLSRPGLSLLAGAALGAGAGAGIGAGVDASAKSKEDGHLLTAVLALLGGIAGAGIGQHADFLAGPLLYRAP